MFRNIPQNVTITTHHNVQVLSKIMHVDADPQCKKIDKNSQIELKGAPQVVIEVSKHLVANVTQFTVKEEDRKKQVIRKENERILWDTHKSIHSIIKNPISMRTLLSWIRVRHSFCGWGQHKCSSCNPPFLAHLAIPPSCKKERKKVRSWIIL